VTRVEAADRTALAIEVTGRHVRVSLIEPGPVATELFTHIRPEIRQAGQGAFAGATLLHAGTITHVVPRPARVVMSEVVTDSDPGVHARRPRSEERGLLSAAGSVTRGDLLALLARGDRRHAG
jgi:NAD(P)-dependent dehydrogenase (short-subunit alcohol dehydrogenase family)